MNRGIRLFLLVLACALLAACEPRVDRGGVKLTINLPTERYLLANGLEVLLHPDHKTPYVHVRMRYGAGAKDDPEGRAGLAHLYEHLMFAAAKHLPTDDYLGTLDRSGATDFNGATGADATTYYETLPAASLEIALFLEGERMGFARSAITPAQLERERRIVREEYHQQTFDQPMGLVYDFAQQALYPTDHPYYPQTAEMDADAAAITMDDVLEFGETYYVPNDATLVVAGDFAEAEIKPLIAKYFAGIAPGKKAPLTRRVVRPKAPRVHEVEAVANVEEEVVILAWSLPAYDEDGFREHVLAGELLGGYTGGRLRKKDDPLSKLGASYSVTPGILSSEFYLLMTAGPGSLSDLVDAYEYTQRWMRDTTELSSWSDEKSAVVAGGLYRIEALESRASELLDYQRKVGVPDGAMIDMRAYEAIDLPRIQRAMSETFSLSNAAIVWVRKDPKAPVAGMLKVKK